MRIETIRSEAFYIEGTFNDHPYGVGLIDVVIIKLEMGGSGYKKSSLKIWSNLIGDDKNQNTIMGDTVSIKGVFSQSANQEAERIMHSKIYVLNMAGQSVRTTTNETVQTLYSMTRFKE